MAKKKKHEEHFDEGWLLPYSDLMTLLLAVFIVLFASSKVDEKKIKEMSQTFQNIILPGGTGFFEEGKTNEPSAPKVDAAKSDSAKVDAEISPILKNIESIKTNMDQYIKENHLNNEIYTKVEDDKLRITLVNNVLYESASAKLSPKNLEIATKIGDLLADTGQNIEIIVAGHTDNLPIHNYEFDSNWDLSFERASNFMKNILKNNRLNPANFSATGYGEYKPIASNDTEEGRSQNRRIEVLIRIDENKINDAKEKEH